METWLKVLLGLFGAGCIFILLVLMIGGGVYNGMVRADTSVGKDWGAVQSAYQRRADLIPNLVAVVQQYSDYEGDTLKAVTQARASIGSARTPSELQAAGGQIDSALSRLLVVVESYPQLKANEQYMKLQDQLEGTENRINFERNNYNEGVQAYQNKMRTFPNNFFAMIFGFDPDKWQTFKADAGAENAPKVADLFHK